MRFGVFLALLILAMPAPAELQRYRNSILGKPFMRTAFGLEIVRITGMPQSSPATELPIAGLSLLRHLQTVTEAEDEDGVYALDIVEPLVSLGYGLRDQERHDDALVHLDRALHITRVQEGILSARQIPLLEAMIDSHLAMGNLSAADAKQQHRYRVAREALAPGDPTLARIISEYARWQRQSYLMGLSGPGYRRIVDIYNIHSSEIRRLEEADPYDPALIEHLHGLLETGYLVSQYQGERSPEVEVSVGGGGFAGDGDNLAIQQFVQMRRTNRTTGERTAERILDILARQEHLDTVALAKAWRARGDWLMWSGSVSSAIKCYRHAWKIYALDQDPGTDPETLFTQPVELPASDVFDPGVLSLRPGYVASAAVRFKVSRQGEAKDVTIVDPNKQLGVGARVALRDMMRNMRYRPVLRDGEAVALGNIERVYSFEY